MILFRLLQLYLCIAVMMVSLLLNSAEPLVIRFDQTPQAQSRFSTAIFRYSVMDHRGSNPCRNDGCSFLCELDGQILGSCLANAMVLKNLAVNNQHNFCLTVMTKNGEQNSSSYSWFIDTIPPTATISSKQSYTSVERLSIDITFNEACKGYGGFKCPNSSNCDVLVSGPAHADASSLRVIIPDIKYRVDIVLSSNTSYGRVIVRVTNLFCRDLAGNQFTLTNASMFTLHFDRRPMLVDLWTSIPSNEVVINGLPRTVVATNRLEDLKIFVDFSTPIMNSTKQLLNAFQVKPSNAILFPAGSHENRRFVFGLRNISKTEIIMLELLAALVIAGTGMPVSPVAPVTLLYDCTKPGVLLSTSLPSATEDPKINVIIEFTKPVFGFEASKVQVKGGVLTRFQDISRALYSLTVEAISENVSIIVPRGQVPDISGNLNSASNELQVSHYTGPVISVALHSFISAGILATSLIAAVLQMSSANLEAINSLSTRDMTTTFFDRSMNLHGMVGHLQVFVLTDYLCNSSPVEYSETMKGLRWLIPREKLPWWSKSSSNWHHHFDLTSEKSVGEVGGISVELDSQKRTDLRNGWSERQQNIMMESTPYGSPLNYYEYYAYFLRGEPLSARSVISRLEKYTGWEDLEMNLFWLGVGGVGLFVIHALALILLRWRTQASAYGTLSIPKFELFLLILMLPCISQSAVFVIRGGTVGGILTGTLLLTIPTSLILSVCLFLMVGMLSGSFARYKEVKQNDLREPCCPKLWHFFTGWPVIGKWFYREGLPSSFLPKFGIFFENRRGPPSYIKIDQYASNGLPKWIDSGQSGIGRMRAVSSDASDEETNISTYHRLLGCARSSYIVLDLVRRVSFGILSGFSKSRGSSQLLFALAITLMQFSYLFSLRPYISRAVHFVECVSLLCEAGLLGLFIRTKGSNPMEGSHLGYAMLAFLFVTFVCQISNQWYSTIKCLLQFSPPQKASFKLGLKCATRGLLLPFLPRSYWSRAMPGSSEPKQGLASTPRLSPDTEFETRQARMAHVVDTLSTMTATVVPVASLGSPGPSATSIHNSTSRGQSIADGNLVKGLKFEPRKSDMKRLRQMARASFPGTSKYEEGSTSYDPKH